MGCIVSLCVAVYFDANSVFLATGCRSRIVEIERQQSVDSREERGVGRVGEMDTKCGTHRYDSFYQSVV